MSAFAAAAKQRISDFIEHVNLHQAEIRALGDEAWVNTPSVGEVEIIRQFLSNPDCGTAFLNQNLTPILNRRGWIVKFASVFLHGMPMVKGWSESGVTAGGSKELLGKRCELGDLQTLFIYLTSDKVVCQMRSVIFQAKLRPENGAHVISHEFQRKLYDECQGFRYQTVLTGQDRRFPSGRDRERALQYLFVADKPVRARTIPSNAGSGAFVDYGEHLLRFLNDATGLEVLPHPDQSMGWNCIVWDVINEVARTITSRAMPRNQGLQEVLSSFNSFESHDRFYFGPGEPEEERSERHDRFYSELQEAEEEGSERHGTFHSQLEEAGEEPFGVQLVIVWDRELNGRSMAIAQRTVPKPLLDLAEEYDTTHIADYDKRIDAKDKWAREMARLLEKDVSRHAVAEIAKSLNSNGLIAALSEAVATAPEGDDGQVLIDLLPFVSWKHAANRLLFALLLLAKKGRLRVSQMEDVVELVHRHPAAHDPHVASLAMDLFSEIERRLRSS